MQPRQRLPLPGAAWPALLAPARRATRPELPPGAGRWSRRPTARSWSCGTCTGRSTPSGRWWRTPSSPSGARTTSNGGPCTPRSSGLARVAPAQQACISQGSWRLQLARFAAWLTACWRGSASPVRARQLLQQCPPALLRVQEGAAAARVGGAADRAQEARRRAGRRALRPRGGLPARPVPSTHSTACWWHRRQPGGGCLCVRSLGLPEATCACRCRGAPDGPTRGGAAQVTMCEQLHSHLTKFASAAEAEATASSAPAASTPGVAPEGFRAVARKKDEELGGEAAACCPACLHALARLIVSAGLPGASREPAGHLQHVAVDAGSDASSALCQTAVKQRCKQRAVPDCCKRELPRVAR